MKKIQTMHRQAEHPIKVLQFGEGNFLRAFVDYGIDVANERNAFNGAVAIVKPRPGNLDAFRAQDHLYTVLLRGIKEGQLYREERVITCVQKVLGAYEDYEAFMELAKLDSLEFVVSNTTEAGIVFAETDALTDCPPTNYPAKLAKFLYERFRYFGGDTAKGLVMLPVELNDGNGAMLKKCVLQYAALWQLEAAFGEWIKTANVFANTLVDRIVSGYPAAEIAALTERWGYEDALAVMGEPFGLWIIEGDQNLAERFPIASDKLTVMFTADLKLYKEQKVRILNGAHTASVLGAYLAGKNCVEECMADPTIRQAIETVVMREIVPTVSLPRQQTEEFARFVFERFANPFVKHALLSIALNSVAKWRARILPTVKDIYARDGKRPSLLTFSFAALAAFYRTTEMKGQCLVGKRGLEPYLISDDQSVLAFFHEHAAQNTAEFVRLLTAREDFWGEDLGALPGFNEAVTADLECIAQKGMGEAIKAKLGKE